MLRVTFADTLSRDNFADRYKLNTTVGDTQLDIGWHLLQAAKLDDKALDYDEVALLTAAPGANSEREFIVKGDPATFTDYATVKNDLGGGFYLVTTTDGTLLGDHVDSIEHNSAPMTFLGNVASINEMPDVDALDPSTSTESQWPRIRVASKYRPLLQTFSIHDINYQSKPEVYLVDSGVNPSHPEFDYPSFEFENLYSIFPNDFNDDKGHGTAVASLLCGKNLGIASNIKLISVKIGNKTYSANLLEFGQAIDAIVAHASLNPNKTRIVNISWGIARSAWLDAKIQGLLDMGMTVICAAGNFGISVEDISPAGMDDVITVGSIDKYDIPSGFNNISPTDSGLTTGHGLSLDIFAPGENVVYAKMTGGYSSGSGTSFSAPLVSGVAAVIAGCNDVFVSGQYIKEKILATATRDALLFEDDRFSENQNNLVYLFTSDPNGNYQEDNISMYLGATTGTGPIVIDINSNLDLSMIKTIHGDLPITYSVVWDNAQLQADYSPFVNCNPVTGIITITNPTVTLPEETKLKMVNFKISATNGVVTTKSPNLFFFHTNTKYADSAEQDITLALTDVHSISFTAFWLSIIK